jgi:putative peptide zinc metalloprotease protein
MDGVAGQWVMQRGPRYFRVGGDVARLAELMDGRRDHTALAESMGQPWSKDLVQRAVSQLDQLGLIDRGDMLAPRLASRIRLVPPLTVQLTVLRPGHAMQRLQPALALIAGRFVGLAAALVAVAGLVALAVQAADVTQVLGEPLPVRTYIAVLLGLLVGTSIHELGHAAALIRYGGRPSRIGIMFFYLMPAFFCDVSDGWRLPRRSQRVWVALAGPAVQTFLAGAAATITLMLAPSELKAGVLFFAIGSYITGALNLLPFIKLDGYIALMSVVDVPYLRLRAMTDARRFLARILFGGTYERELTNRWTTAYGLACLSFPVYLLSTALTLWIGVLQRAGLAGLLLLGCGTLYVIYLVGRGTQRLAHEIRTAGANHWRVRSVTAALATGLCALMFTPASYSVQAAYVTRSGNTELVLLDGADTADLAAGQRVELLRNGVLLHSRVGSATIAAANGKPGTAPLSSFFPLSLASEPHLPVTSYPLALKDRTERTTGAARVLISDVPLWEVAYRSYLKPFG